MSIGLTFTCEMSRRCPVRALSSAPHPDLLSPFEGRLCVGVTLLLPLVCYIVRLLLVLLLLLMLLLILLLLSCVRIE